MKNIRILAIIMTLCLLLTMVACGNNEDEPQSTETPTTKAPTTEAPTTEAPTTEAPTTDNSGDEPTPTIKYPWATQGGDGTEASPLIINQTNFLAFYEYYKVGSFEAFSTELEYFKLGSDIVVNQGDADDRATTAPETVFGAPLSDFFGVLDGDGHTISGICLKTDKTYSRASLIRQLYGTVKNLRITNSYFEINGTSYEEVATIAGRLNGGIIENCYSDAILQVTPGTGANVHAGGLAGRVNERDGSKITNCVFAGKIDAGAGYAGGIVAGNNGRENLSITNCLNLGSVKGASCSGGIIGRDDKGGGSTSSMTRCVNLSKTIYKIVDGVDTLANFMYGGGLSKFGVNDVYVINEFASVSTSANNENGIMDGIADVYHKGFQTPTVHKMSLAGFLALGGTDDAPEGWYFKDGYVPVPIQGLEIPLAGYLTTWGITLS